MDDSAVVRPRWLGVVASLLLLSLVVLFLWLGFWQLDRAAGKEGVAEELALSVDKELISLKGDELDLDFVRYREVEVIGTFIGKGQFFLDNRKLKRKAGYYVMTPLAIFGSDRALLVNRGWVSQGESRDTLPLVPLADGENIIRGLVRVPVTNGFRLDEISDSDLRLYIDLKLVGESIGKEMLPFVVRQNYPDRDRLIREWSVEERDSDASMHYGYALQWFAFALLIIGGWIAIVIKQRKEILE
ncbi:MAG: SURF1 family protein [Thiotrichales bacterium]|nr:SURF1 family protein [Thiotrichales bacterium]MBT3613787.1 SURF1 family protein [Thiotrichales bacterium]MBT3753227.1 SURF1 family protein [Thiotrichales bacterium]MBT3837868.1 SURF1 family protein [Thiotrichales bacterium]MBT4152079.1 SURF1 family protein [Thiotrichales bacterium]